MKIFISTLIAVLFASGSVNCQTVYFSKIKTYQANYISTHEVVKGKNKQYFRFFTIDSNYRIKGCFEKIKDSTGFSMKTSGSITHQYYKYGKVSFLLKDTLLQLFVYQSKDLLKNPLYKDYLFIPFTDITSGDESYGGGRYLDFFTDSIKNNSLTLDFNKAYNPYCAYANGFHCPLPPKENDLPVAIMAGEKVFGKSIH